MLETWEKNYKHAIDYDEKVHVKNEKGQYASACVLFDFNSNANKTCDDKKRCIVLDGSVCKCFRGGISGQKKTI